jgi:hypothetical protein
MKKILITGECSSMGVACQMALEGEFHIIAICRCRGYDLTKPSFYTGDQPLDAVVHIPEIGPDGLTNVWNVLKGNLAPGAAFIGFSSVHHLKHNDPYAESKRAQERLLKEWAIQNPSLRINALRLGHIAGTKAWPKEDASRLPEIPLGRFGTPEDVAGAVKFLVTNQWITGTVLTLDGGMSLL